MRTVLIAALLSLPAASVALAAGPGGPTPQVIWKDAAGTTLPVTGNLALGGALQYFDSNGVVWNLDPVMGAFSLALGEQEQFYPTSDCSGPAYLIGAQPPLFSFAFFISSSAGIPQVAFAFPTTAVQTVNITAASVGVPGFCNQFFFGPIPGYPVSSLLGPFPQPTPSIVLPIHPVLVH